MTSFGLRLCPAVLFVLVGMAQASDRPPLTTPQYVEQLRNYENQIAEIASAPQKAVNLRDSIPGTLTVHPARGDVPAALIFLRDALNRSLTATAQVKPT